MLHLICQIGSYWGCGLMIVMALFQAFRCRHLFNPCNVVNFDIVEDLTPTESESMFQKIVDVDGPKGEAAANMLFIMTLTCRLESACFVGMGLAAIGTLIIPVEERYPALLVFGLVGAVAMSVSLNHAGCLPCFGKNPFLTKAGKKESQKIVILWTLTHLGLWTGFIASLAARAEAKEAKGEYMMM